MPTPCGESHSFQLMILALRLPGRSADALKAENERLRQELALLQEEIRIKDARTLRIPAQRRPHYPPAGYENTTITGVQALPCASAQCAAKW